MTESDICFFQGIANDIMRYLSRAEIQNENEEKRATLERARFKIFTSVADATQNAVLQLDNNTLNRQAWTKKELSEMPFLKDMKYRKTKDGIHQFRYRRDGFNVACCSKNYETAKQKARDFIAGLKQKQREEIVVKHVNTVAYVAKLWGDLKCKQWAKQSARTYLGVLKNHVLPVFGNRSVKTLLPMDMQPFFDELSAKQSRTAEDAKVLLNGIFRYAIANRLCTSNPVAGVYVPKHARKCGKALTDEQLQRFKAIMSQKKERCLAYLIILYSGIRGAELESMTFDWEQGTFTVKNAKLKTYQKHNPDNLTRTVPITPGLYSLRSRIETEKWNYKSATLSSKLFLYWTETTVKDLRHTFTTKAREAGIDNELVNLWTGHLPGNNVTANIYTHFSLSYQIEQAKKLPIY